ncbi:MAG: hypothetical protein ACKO96_39035 [Flammeovirgaceae bacterium]
MKSVVRGLLMMACVVLTTVNTKAQVKLDEERMQRDIEVAENVLSTLLKQQFDKRSFFPMEVRGSYRSGYGVTFQLPVDNVFMVWGETTGAFLNDNWSDGNWTEGFDAPVVIRNRNGERAEEEIARMKEDANRIKKDQQQKNNAVGRGQARVHSAQSRTLNRDSLRDQSSAKMLEAARQFLADYGDLITQLAPNERIVITNKGEENQFWFNGLNMQSRRSPYLSIEALKSDIAELHQGKLTREQFMNKLRVVNTESENDLHPDLELLSSIFNRLYRSDLSKSYFVQENTYYEKLKDFGAIYYMQVYSTNAGIYGDDYDLPTLGLRGLNAETRDEKVKELYPVFTTSIKDDILEYGKTLKSLKNDESLIFNIKLTRCKGCKIPSWVEYSIKYSVLKDYGNGKISKEAALTKFTEKKGELQ